MSPEIAYLALNKEDKLREFVQATNKQALTEGDGLLVTLFTPLLRITSLRMPMV